MVVWAIALCEERILKYRLPLYIGLCVVLVSIATFKEVGFDNDSENYEFSFMHYDDTYVMLGKEYSFYILSKFFRTFTDDVHIMFFIYAGTGIVLKMIAFTKLSKLYFLPVLIYLGNYYILHDLTQIRACLVSGLLLYVVIYISEGKKRKAALLLLIGCIFHYSTLAMFPLLLMGNKSLTNKQRLIWSLIVPAGFALCVLKINLLTEIPIPYIGEKLAMYQELSEKGVVGGTINVFNAVFVVTCLAYLYILYFYDTIIEHNKYLPIMIKMTGLSIGLFLVLSFLPVLAFRISELYGIVEIIVFSTIYYTIKPEWLAKSVVAIFGLALFCINVFYVQILHS